MEYVRPQALIGLVVLITGCLGQVGGPDPSGQRTSMMSGGTPAVPGQFPATVYIPGCTATKVGERRFLTAAHCVVDRTTMTIEATFARDARLSICTGVDLAKESQRHEVTVLRTEIHPTYAAKLLASDGLGVQQPDFAKVFDLALIEVLEPTDPIGVASLDHSPQPKGQKIVVGGYGLKVDTTLPFGDGSGGVIVSGEEGETDGEPQPTNRLDCAATTIDGTDGTVHLVRNGYTIDGVHVLSGGIFDDEALKLLPGDSGGAVYLDNRPDDVELGEHRFATVVGVNSFTGLGHSAFSRIDEPCLRQALEATEQQEHGTEELPLLCAP